MKNETPAQKSLTLVVELENSSTVGWQESLESIRPISKQLGEWLSETPNASAEVFFVYSGDVNESSTWLQRLTSDVPELLSMATVRCLNVSNGRYYELKNRGIAEATGDIVVILDSDAIPQEGWLQQLVEPFRDDSTVAVGGQTSLKYDDFLSKTLALIWIFPLRNDRLRWKRTQILVANNCAFRADWIKKNPFAINPGFKVDCTLLIEQLKKEGRSVVRSTAEALHQPLRGWRFLLWRAFVLGKDADRKHCILKSSSKWRRLIGAVSFWYKMERRALLRIFGLQRNVSMPLWQVPIAALIGFVFYCTAFVGNVSMTLGLSGAAPERIPHFAEHQ